MKILVIFTGGTIGSTTSGNLIDVDARASYQLLQAYRDANPSADVDFVAEQPIYILSENIVPAQWHVLIELLQGVDQSLYDGVIIAHGTNTLAYSAAAVSFALQDFRLPVLLVSSNYTLDDPRANGLSNFTHAIDFISDCGAPGVFVVYRNNAGESVVHLGSRLLEAVPFSDEFDSVGGIAFGKMVAGHFIADEHPCNPTLAELEAHRSPLAGKLGFSSELLLIRPYAGMNYDFFRFAGTKPKAVLHDLYHTGSANTLEDDSCYSIRPFLAHCREQGIDLYAAPIAARKDLYVSTKKLIDAGVIPVEGMSLEAALVKLMLKYGSPQTKIDINQPIFFEKIEEPLV